MTDTPRPGDQQLPTILADAPVIQDLVIDDIYQRTQLGIERYGTGLQGFNGRDMLRDAYEEALDLATYLRGAIYERDNSVAVALPVSTARIEIDNKDGLRIYNVNNEQVFPFPKDVK